MRGAEPIVDIVVTNHNYGRFLEQALSSACGQTYPHVNVIVVDDGSTDDSREILRRFERRVDVVLKEQGGQASALNAGIARGHGDIRRRWTPTTCCGPTPRSGWWRCSLPTEGSPRSSSGWP